MLKARLTLEPLDGRIMPANLGYTNGMGNGLFDVAANWRNLNTGQTASAPPAPGDSLTFDGALTQAGLNNLHGFNLPDTVADFTALNFINGYNGTVTFAPDGTPGLTTATFLLTTGAIAQPVANTDLSVLGAFTWTGGTLNSSGNAANVNVYGGGTLSPTNAGAVTLGSTLNIGDGTAAVSFLQNPGTLVVNGGLGINLNANANMTAKTYTQGDIIGITKNQAGAKKAQILANATLGVEGPGTYTNNLEFENAGSFNLTGSTRVTLNGAPPPPGYDYTQSNGAQLKIENGSELTVARGMKINGGTVLLAMNAALPANQQKATIKGDFVFNGGTVLFSAPLAIGTTPAVYGEFVVDGAVFWVAGTYKPGVDYTTAGLANKWSITGNVGVLGPVAGCIIDPVPYRGANPPANSTWLVLDANATTNNTVATMAAGCPLTVGLFQVGQKSQWKLSS